MNIILKSKRLFTVARFQGMSTVVFDSNTARPSTFLLFYSIGCALTVTITLQWALVKLFTRLYSNTKQEVVMTILITFKYTFLEWKIIFGYLSQIVNRKDIANVLNEAMKIENYLKKFRLNRHHDKEYNRWCTAKQFSNWFQVISSGCSFIIGCFLYTDKVLLGDVIVFTITTYCQIMPTILSSMYFFYLALSLRFYRIINRNIRSFKNGVFSNERIEQLNCLYNVVTKYTENVCKLFSSQILATLFYASALILVEVFFLYYNIQKFWMNKYLYEFYGDLIKNCGLIACYVVEIYFICTITDLVMSEMEVLCLSSLLKMPEIFSCGLFRIDKRYILTVITSIISQAIIIIQFKMNENTGKSSSDYRSGWNMEGLKENKVLHFVANVSNETRDDQ